MEGLFNAIKDTVTAGINGDWTKLGTSIVSIRKRCRFSE